MAIEFRCPNCEKKLKTGDDKAGRTAKCPQCGTSVTVPASSAVAEDDFSGFPPLDEAAPNLPPRRGSAGGTQVACPMCGAMNEPTAPRCYACGENLYVSEAAGGPSGSRRFGDVWRSAWERWSANLGVNVAAALIAFVIMMAGYVALIVMLMVGGFGLAAAAGNGGAIAGGFILALLVGYFLMFVIYCYLLVGFSNFALRQARSGNADLGALFPSISRLGPSMLCTLVTAIGLSVISAPGFGLYIYGTVAVQNNEGLGILLVLVGYALMMFGWCVGWTLFWPVQYLVADRPGAWLSPIGEGVSIAASNFKLSFLMALVHAGLLFAGSMACYVGLLFSIPLSFVLFAVAYDRCLRAALSEGGNA